MDLNSSLQDDLTKHCHVNTNKEGDSFVGIKANSDNAMVYFPIGYELPKTDEKIRADIRRLIRVLSEFTTKEERLIAAKKYTAKQKVDFPINAYNSIIEHYFSSGGKYCVEMEPTYKSSSNGKIDWPRTIRNQVPLVQQKDGVSSFIYTKFTVRTTTPNDSKQITQINRFCVYEAFRRLGWLYVPYIPEKVKPYINVKASIAILNTKLRNTNDDRRRSLFQAMKDMLEFMDENIEDKQLYFGTDNFEHVWEKLIDKVFGERDKKKYFPRSRWILKYGKYKEKRPLIPDTIMIYKEKYYILDAKYYKYGWTGIPDHLPNGSSINKQITYGEYLTKQIKDSKGIVFNAFIMPYSKDKNCFGFDTVVENIGEALGDWRSNKIPYEHIQGIVMDVRYLMHHYIGNQENEKAMLVDCIEKSIVRGYSDNLVNSDSNLSSNTLKVAEKKASYGSDKQ